MAAKIKEGLRDITQGVVERLKGGPKYADNLLGESLQDQLRKATGRELLEPSEELTSQVVDTINQDITNGKDSKEIVVLLKKRLRNDNPHKQWLAVLLVGRVMCDCASTLGSHQEELLQEVARVMTRPSRQDSSAGKTTRQAAKELLRSYGRAGTSAFRAINRSTLESASASAEYTAAINAAVAREAANVVEEVKALIEQAQANTELLSEMLVVEQEQAAQGQGQEQVGEGQQFGAGLSAPAAPRANDDFESELTTELVTEVRELRALFDAYLEQLQSMSGEPQVDEVMIKALEAVDMLDGALALQKDVASNQREIEQQATAAVGGGAGAAAGSNTAGDLIMLDDVPDALPQPQPVLATQPSAAAAKPPPMAPLDLFAVLDPVAIQATLSPSSAQPQPSNPVHVATVGGSGQPTFPAPHSTFPPHPQQPHAYVAPPLSPPQQQQHLHQQYGVYGTVAPLQAAYPGVSPPPAGPPTNTTNPFVTPAIPPALPVASAGLVPATSGNPFEPQVTQSALAGMGGMGGATGSGNPFTQPPAPSGGSAKSVMDSEWAMFFANRSAGAAAAQQQH